MSIWRDMHKRSLGIEERKENTLPCLVLYKVLGKGTKCPKWLSVPDYVRIQRIYMIFFTAEQKIAGGVACAWSYRVGERNMDDFYVELTNLVEEFGDFTYNINEKGVWRLSDKSVKMKDELHKRVAKHNEEVSGRPFWSVDKYDKPLQ